MAEATDNATQMRWNIPPEDQSGDVSRVDRYVAKRTLKATAIWVARPTEPREKELISILHETCKQMGISPVPKLLIYHSNKPNAASSITRSILFSTNLLDTMSHDQIKAVMGHELVHHKHRRMDFIKDLALDMGLIIGYCAVRDHLQNTCSKFASSKPVRYAVDAAAVIGLKVLSLWRSRRREYRSDKGGAEVAGPDAMIGALETLHKRSQEVYKQEEQQGKKHYWLKYAPDFLKSHPSHEQRIAHLARQAPHSFRDKHISEPQADTPLTAR